MAIPSYIEQWNRFAEKENVFAKKLFSLSPPDYSLPWGETSVELKKLRATLEILVQDLKKSMTEFFKECAEAEIPLIELMDIMDSLNLTSKTVFRHASHDLHVRLSCDFYFSPIKICAEEYKKANKQP